MKILIAEDDTICRDLLSTVLKRYDHDVTEAEDGEQALKLYQQDDFQVVVCDWRMPNMDGLELCRNIRSSDNKPYIYLIMLTAYGGKKNYMEGMKAGVDDFLTKPYDPEELQTRMIVAERILKLLYENDQLHGLLPTCSYCKKIRDESDNWIQIEQYIAQRSKASFSHGICPTCYETEVKPELEEFEKEE